jgi:hypothetical protein
MIVGKLEPVVAISHPHLVQKSGPKRTRLCPKCECAVDQHAPLSTPCATSMLGAHTQHMIWNTQPDQNIYLLGSHRAPLLGHGFGRRTRWHVMTHKQAPYFKREVRSPRLRTWLSLYTQCTGLYHTKLHSKAFHMTKWPVPHKGCKITSGLMTRPVVGFSNI